MTEKPDPFYIEALERSVNDSATRVSTIWISFLIFGLYLLTAVGTVTHRQILLADPIKLPVLNVELPLFGFVVLAPILFVILHVYVLIQVLLLGRTAAAYNQVLDRVVKSPMGNASMRQRLANTLFAQLFAGSPSEREGWLGWLLKIMAWFTLAFAPVLDIEKFITESASGISNPRAKQAAIDRIRSGLIGDPTKDDKMAIEQVWHKCEQVSSEVSQADFEKKISTFLRVVFCTSKIACKKDPFCDSKRTANVIAMRIMQGWISDDGDYLSVHVARGLLGEDGKPCAASGELDDKIKKRLRELTTDSPPDPSIAR